MFRSSSCCSPLIRLSIGLESWSGISRQTRRRLEKLVLHGLSILLVTLLLSWVSPAIQQIIGEGEMNENRSSNTLCCAWNIRTGWNPDIGDRLWLWSAALTHTYGLIAFVGLDLALIFAVWRVTRVAVFGALLTATFQLVAMLGDIVGGQPAGMSPSTVLQRQRLALRSEEHTSELQSLRHLVCRI